ncbi:hypothetical protein NDU88_008650 [Pleurodeles waltl]|uniref:Uncharacterized protein n=1 Tax=Pleurodeles waltl TaxID=8319 RepID=A0AAV7RV90_PLEWA|nr:hypothetical protein NDU88_008650 [Pleurodeles waltl]
MIGLYVPPSKQGLSGAVTGVKRAFGKEQADLKVEEDLIIPEDKHAKEEGAMGDGAATGKRDDCPEKDLSRVTIKLGFSNTPCALG